MEALKLQTVADLLVHPDERAPGSTTGQATDRTRARIPPFDAIEPDLADLLGIDG